MHYSRYIGAASLLLLSLVVAGGCTMGPVDPEKICNSALQGTSFDTGTAYQDCKRSVSRAGFHAAHQAAQPYRNMPR